MAKNERFFIGHLNDDLEVELVSWENLEKALDIFDIDFSEEDRLECLDEVICKYPSQNIYVRWTWDN